MSETASLGARARPARARLAVPRAAIPLLSFLLFLAIGVPLALNSPFPGNDELEHVSYAAWLREEGRVLPRFEEQRTLRRDDLSRWDWKPNYVGHPSPFYVLMAPLVDRAAPLPGAVMPARLASLSLLSVAVALSLGAAFRVLRRDRLALAVACAAIALCPQVLSLAAMVTNDALAVLGGALAIWGVSAAPRRVRDDLAAGAGLMLALWAKPNAGVEAGVVIVAVMVLAPAGRWRLFGAAVAGGVLGLLPVLPIVLRYGTLVPVTAETVWEVASIRDPAAYLLRFLPNLLNTWGFQRVGAWPLIEASAPATIAAVAAMLVCVAWGAWWCRRRGGGAVALAGVVTAVVVLPLHAGFAATALGGSLPAASFRYDLPIWPALAIGLGGCVTAAGPWWRRAAVVGVAGAALLLGWAP